MDEWQKRHIDKNLVELMKATVCNTLLVSSLKAAGILGQNDLEALELPFLTSLERSRKLYQILQTRTGTFEVLLKSLEETSQSGAVHILQQHKSIFRYFGCISFDQNHVLGTGCTGTKVYKGTFGGMDVAVKVMDSGFILPTVALKEVNFLKTLDKHENIVRYCFAEAQKHYICIALELCDISLDDAVRSRDMDLNPVDVLWKCTNGLSHIHKHNIIHGDLKPANILLTKHQVKLSDFGLSKQIPVGKTSVSVHSGVKGTADWMAPEILQHWFDFDDLQDSQPLRVSTSADIFSLGCIYFFVLSNGKHPFGKTPMLQVNIVSGQPQLQLYKIEAQWLQLIKKMIHHQPSDRPSCEAVLVEDCFIHCTHKPPPSTDVAINKTQVPTTVQIESPQETYSTHYSVPSTHLQITAKLDTQQLQSKSVSFGEEISTFEEVCQFMAPEVSQKCIEDASECNQLLSDEPITLMVGTFPPRLPYYIPRTIYTQTEVVPDIVNKLIPDIFCIEGLDLYQISSLLIDKNDISDKSTNQILHLTARIILLEHPDHFQNIVIRTRKNVHWLRNKGGKYFHVKSSTGIGIANIKTFLVPNSSEIFSEDEFLERCLNSPRNVPVLLYDSQGMGKTILLAELALKMKEQKPKRSIIFLPMSKLVANVGYSSEGYRSAEEVKRALVKISTTDRFGTPFIENLFNCKDHKVELFIDAFDQVHETELTAAYDILECITKECKNIRMFLTTRSHRRDELQKQFCVLGNSISPFDEANKLNFCLQYWNSEHLIEITQETRAFAVHCLECLSKVAPPGEKNLAEFPLQCRRLAELYAKDAKTGAFNPPRETLESSMLKLHIDTKFYICCSNGERQIYYDFHVHQAIKKCFPKTEKNRNDYPVSDYQLVYRIGILVPGKLDSQTPLFILRKFAEYFTGEFLATSATSTFTNHLSESDFTDLLYENALNYRLRRQKATFRHTTLCYFLNFFLSSMHSPGQNFGSLKHALRDSKYYNSSTLLNLLESSLERNFVDLYCYLLDMYLDLNKSTNKSSGLLKFEQCLHDRDLRNVTDKRKLQLVKDLKKDPNFHKLVAIATQYSSFNLVKLSCSLLESVTCKKFYNFQYDKFLCPIYFAAIKGNYQMFDYFFSADRDRFCKNPLLHWCLSCSYGQKGDDKVEILKMILHERPALLNNLDPDHKCVPLLVDGIRFDLLKVLCEAGADLSQTNWQKQNIAHLSAKLFSVEEYHELVELVISQNAQTIFNQHDSDNMTPIHIALERIDLKSETLELLVNSCNVHFNNCSKLGTEFELAVNKRSDGVVKDIIRLGGDKTKLKLKTKKFLLNNYNI